MLLTGLLYSVAVFSESVDPDAKSCFESICNSRLDYVSNYDVSNESDSQLRTWYFKNADDEIDSLVGKKFDEIVKTWDVRFSAILEIKNGALNIEKSKGIDLLVFTSFSAITDRFSDYFNKGIVTFADGPVRGAFDYDKTKAMKLLLGTGYSASESLWITKLEKELYTNFKFSGSFIAAVMQDEIPEPIFAELLNKKDLAIFYAVHEHISIALQKLKGIDGLTPSYQLVQHSIVELEKVKQMTELPSFILEELHNTLMVANIIVDYERNGVMFRLINSIPNSLMDEAYETVSKENLGAFNPNKQADFKEKETKEKILNDCMHSVSKFLGTGVSTNEVRGFANELNFIKKQAETFALRYGGIQSQYLISERMNVLEFNLPASREFIYNHVKEQLSEDVVSVVDETSKLQKFPLITLGLNKSDPFSLTSITEDVCGDHGYYDYLTDAVLSSNTRPTARVNWRTVKYIERYKMVLAHEVGHVLYKALDTFLFTPDSNAPLADKARIGELITKMSSSYSNLKTVTQENRFIKNSNQSLITTIYTDEDFADIFSAYVYKGKRAYNSMCMLLDGAEDQLKLVNQDVTDTHSASFYRVISTELNKEGSLPKSCKNFLGKQDKIKVQSIID